MKKFLVAIFIAGFGISAFGASCDNPDIKNIISKINGKAPMRVDETTTFLGVSCKNGVLEYKYDLNDIKDVKLSEFSIEEKKRFDEQIMSRLQNSYCTKLEAARKETDGINWVYMYNGKKFFEAKFKNSDCK